jgi:hypothetical protein
MIWSNLTGTIPSAAWTWAGEGGEVARAGAGPGCRVRHRDPPGTTPGNAPMLAVNEWLGYRVSSGAWTAEKASVIRFALTLVFFGVLSLVVGSLVSGDDYSIGASRAGCSRWPWRASVCGSG